MAAMCYPNPEDALVAEIVECFSDERRFEFEERAAIMEFDGGLSRAHAECLALIDLIHHDRLQLSDLQVVAFQRGEMTDWLLASNLAAAQAVIDQLGGMLVEVHRPADILHEQFDGVAMLMLPE